jgi:hypothetical protein
MNDKKKVVARLTVIRASGYRTIVEVHSDATFSNFYRFHRQLGAKRSTKQFVRFGHQTEGCQWIGMQHQHKPSLETIAKRLEFYASQSNPVVSKRIRIIHKRAYKKLLSARPDELGLTKTRPLPIYAPVASRTFCPSGSLGDGRLS